MARRVRSLYWWHPAGPTPANLRVAHAMVQTLEATLRDAMAGRPADLNAAFELTSTLNFGFFFLSGHVLPQSAPDAEERAEPTVTPEDTLRRAGISGKRQAAYQRKMSTLLAGRA